jgi:3-isopropylmalate/(R)-2-methylmalate dehydratase small subunit
MSNFSRAPFLRFTSRMVHLPQTNIDTDQIFPARFLSTTTRHNLGECAFAEWRFGSDGKLDPDCVLNQIDPAQHRVLLAGRNFGCGSSREHAPWALVDFGFLAVVSTEIADIFRNNAINNGLLPIIVNDTEYQALLDRMEDDLTIDLETSQLRIGDVTINFAVDPFGRECLMKGTDTLGWLLDCLPEVEAFERKRGAVAEFV